MLGLSRRLLILASAVGALVLAVGVMGAPASFAQDAVKIGVVNLDQVLVESQAGKDLQGSLDEFSSQVQAEGENKAQATLELRQQITDGASTLSQEKLTEMQGQYEALAADLRKFRDDKQREGQTLQQNGLKEIEQQLQPIFETIRDEGAYDLILNFAPGVVVMMSEKIDITEQVVERLDAATAE